ncbi:hypothetical protein M2191_008652 [Bradyrhizobium japonicum]|nr:hypothetical protein [Bradyrhizobium japonicum]
MRTIGGAQCCPRQSLRGSALAGVSAVAARSTRGCLCSRFGTVSLKPDRIG